MQVSVRVRIPVSRCKRPQASEKKNEWTTNLLLLVPGYDSCLGSSLACQCSCSVGLKDEFDVTISFCLRFDLRSPTHPCSESTLPHQPNHSQRQSCPRSLHRLWTLNFPGLREQRLGFWKIRTIRLCRLQCAITCSLARTIRLDRRYVSYRLYNSRLLPDPLAIAL